MFGRLIADRKFLATFYTLPSSARCWRSWQYRSWTWTGATPTR